MNPVKKIIRSWHAAIYHYRLFGKDGIAFLLRKRKSSNKLLQIKMKGYDFPLFLRNNTTDIPMFYHIFSGMDYDIQVNDDPKTIIDCGAHIGLGAIFFAKKYPNAKIISVEAEASNYEMLVKNTSNYPQIYPVFGAIWNEKTALKVVDVNLGNWGYMVEPTAEGVKNPVPAITIDELINTYKLESIDICKINIEGAEKELFASNYNHWLSITKVLVIELHDRMRKGCTKSLFNALQDFDFQISWKGFSLVIQLNHSPAGSQKGNPGGQFPTT
ncbi:FkbM family methyltransferase [Flavihumibacter profundi]|uniref:FkbM family methyltransferase n=1 Tax=Flavihumibacter profundi TaxID=2716883 RepID=UPI001CC650C6|nr:FkbM family methyltransferase [Flavihumibacter profundi]MBZ5858030.1 FkbM family methyltransferase [Flavihumibacter profundi]